MRPRGGSHWEIRVIAAIASIAIVGAAIAGCGGDGTSEPAGSGPSKGTYVNGSSPEEYCSVLESAKPSLSADIDADDEAVLAAIHTIKDIEPLAPEETRADWSQMRLLMQAVAEANGSDTVGTMSRAEAGEAYAELSGRLSESVAEICGFPLS
ncbi:MAG TPA: hypothetical protein VFZ37_19300 [Jiangellaceae bacterium]